MARHRILVADDHEEVRALVAELLGSEFDVVATTGDGRAALKATALLQPELVVLDISMPAVNGLEVAAQMARWPEAPAIVFLTVHAEPEFMDAARLVGASGYVLKRKLATELLPAVHRALERRAAPHPPDA